MTTFETKGPTALSSRKPTWFNQEKALVVEQRNEFVSSNYDGNVVIRMGSEDSSGNPAIVIHTCSVSLDRDDFPLGYGVALTREDALKLAIELAKFASGKES